MNDNKNKFKNNLRHISIRKKTASRICSTQVLYGASFLNCDIISDAARSVLVVSVGKTETIVCSTLHVSFRAITITTTTSSY